MNSTLFKGACLDVEMNILVGVFDMEKQRDFPEITDSIILSFQRDRLDLINNKVINLLADRMSVCMEIAELKALHGIPMMQPERIVYVLESLKKKSVQIGLRSEYVEELFILIIRETCAQEQMVINRRVTSGQPL